MTKLDFIEPDFETLVMDERNGIDYVPFKTPIVVKDGWHLIFQQSCHGLVLCTIRVGGRRRYVVYNPSTRQCKTLPSPQFRITGVPHVMSVSIAFDPAKSSYLEAVYVCRTDNSEGMLHIEIYSPKTDSWRDAGEPFPFSKSGKLLISGVYWNGSVHWIDNWTGTLHYFDIDCELMKNIALPTEPNHYEDSRRRIVYFNECRGHIHLVETRKDDMPGFDIWELRSDYTGWNLNYYVDLSPLITVYPGIVNDRTVSRLISRLKLRVLFVEEGQDSSSRLILSITNDKLISFYLKSKCFKEMYDVKPDVWVQGFEYIETLAHA
ncbi:F-box protein At5g07610-like [Papaver somniferum]|uniref:F-box protein At5g07610-like n=1 Tax=Papaver somniferum TaxID=3469 RepID=UPI000E6FB2D5|nr:F-box protein At5g07610-like [Papaver somniferum]